MGLYASSFGLKIRAKELVLRRQTTKGLGFRGGLQSTNSTSHATIASMSKVPLKQIEYGVYGDLINIYPKPYSISLRGTICLFGELGGSPADSSGEVSYLQKT